MKFLTMTRPTAQGFTLLELLIVILIIGILAGFGYPAYQRHVTETRRSDAYSALSQLANDLEKFYSECGTYPTSASPSNIVGAARSCTVPAGGTLGRAANGDLTQNGYYRLTIDQVPANGQSYRLNATPLGIQLQNDTDCAVLRMTNTGATSASGSNTARCWRR